MFNLSLPYPAEVKHYFSILGELPWAAWLDSGGRGRYDILTAQPYAILWTRGASTEIRSEDGVRISTDPPFDLLREQLGAPIPGQADLPFAGGALGYWGYDLARRDIKLAEPAHEADPLPEMAIGLYDWALVIDHQQQCVHLASHLRQPETAAFLTHLAEQLVAVGPRPPTVFRVTGEIRANFSASSYAAAFDRVQCYLHAGDCYQVNLAQCFSAPAEGDAYAAYLALREISPAPFAAFLNLPQVQILCASPERFLRVHDGQVETKPIKGTRPRGADAAADAANLADLRSHPKDRAENLMIVDLLRNDLGRCCVPGSVRTPELFAVESYANVHHLVSTVTGQLAVGEDALSLLRACFPGGSITGAPKQRAMQIIDELEPQRRGVYCGVIGYIGFDGNMDSNIAIRTLVFSGDEIRCWAGGGLVADSVVEAEYQETLDKASGMLELVRRFST